MWQFLVKKKYFNYKSSKLNSWKCSGWSFHQNLLFFFLSKLRIEKIRENDNEMINTKLPIFPFFQLLINNKSTIVFSILLTFSIFSLFYHNEPNKIKDDSYYWLKVSNS